MLPQFTKCFIQRLRHDPSIAYRRHEIRVTVPARQKVKMNVAVDACTARATEIHTEVVSVRPIFDTYSLLGNLSQIHQLVCRTLVSLRDKGQVRIRRNHQMPAGIWKTIQNDKIVAATKKDVARFVRLCSILACKPAEEAFDLWRLGRHF